MKNLKYTHTLIIIIVGIILVNLIVIGGIYQLYFNYTINDKLEDYQIDKVKELSNVAYSILEKNYLYVENDILPPSKAMTNAINEIRNLKYGEKKKGYFWIFSYDLKMVMESSIPTLKNKDLTNLLVGDVRGKIKEEDVDTIKKGDLILHNDMPLFESMLMISKEIEAGVSGGTIRHMWPNPKNGQWEDKLSYVRAFPKWEWVIGTGIYQEGNSVGDIKSSALSGIIIFTMISSFLIIALILKMMLPFKTAINDIAEKTRRYSEFDFSDRIEVVSSLDELNVIQDSMNTLIDVLSQKFKATRNLVKKVSDTSNDLIEIQMEQLEEIKRTGGDLDDYTSSFDKNIQIVMNSTKKFTEKFEKLNQPFERLAENLNNIAAFMADVNKAMYATSEEEIEVDIERIKDTFEYLKQFKNDLVGLKKEVNGMKKEFVSFNKSIYQVSNLSNKLIKSVSGGINSDRDELDLQNQTIRAVQEVTKSVDEIVKLTKNYKF